MISVIIPNYNSAHYLESAVRSVLAQTFTDYEIIVVDDGSTDNSQQVIASLGDHIRCIRQANQGLAGARNAGIRAARGELIGLLDADDEWCSTYLQHMMELSKQHPRAAVFYCMAQCMDADQQDLPQVVGGPPVDPDQLYPKLLRANFIIPSTVTFRRKPIVDAGYFDDTLRSCEDWDLWLRLLPSALIVGSSETLVRYRIHGTSLSTNVDGMHAAAKKVIEKNFGPEDTQISSWSFEKRRAYGGVYRYYLITAIQRQNDWRMGSFHLQKALEMDPSLAVDLDMFYDLALGVQPNGYRGSDQHLDVHRTAFEIEGMLAGAFSNDPKRSSTRRRAYGTANFALGLIAYNTGLMKYSRAFLTKALFFRPDLLLDSRVLGNITKSFLPSILIRKMKYWASNIRSMGSVSNRTVR